MKKGILVFGLIVLFAIILFFALRVKADTIPDPGQSAGNILGVNPNDIPMTQEDIANKYLRKEWAAIATNSTWYGPIHKFLLANPFVFRVLIGMPYEFSLLFFGALIIWFILVFWTWRILYAKWNIKSPLNWLVALVGWAVISQSKAIIFVVGVVLDIILRRENWWARLIIMLAVLVAVIIFNYFMREIDRGMIASKEKKDKAELKHAGNVVKTIAHSAVEAKKEFSNEDGEPSI